MAAGSTASVSPVSAAARVAPVSREAPLLVPGDLLRLAPGGSSATGWRLESLGGGQVLTLMQPPLENLAHFANLLPGDELLLRVVSVLPRLTLEVVASSERGQSQRAQPQGPQSLRPDSGWSELSALRADVADWRRQVLADPGMPARSLTAAQLVQAWAEAMAQSRPPTGPDDAPFWLLPQPYWVRREREPDHPHGDAAAPGEAPDEPALSLLMKWRGAAIGIQLQGPRHALRLTLLAESEAAVTVLRGELPHLVAALMRAGVRLQRLGWRQQALWVPVDPFPHLRADAALLGAAAELMIALGLEKR